MKRILFAISVAACGTKSGGTPDGTRLIVTDLGYNRILIWNTIPTSNAQPADMVVAPNGPLPLPPDRFLVTMADGSDDRAGCISGTTTTSGHPCGAGVAGGSYNWGNHSGTAASRGRPRSRNQVGTRVASRATTAA